MGNLDEHQTMANRVGDSGTREVARIICMYAYMDQKLKGKKKRSQAQAFSHTFPKKTYKAQENVTPDTSHSPIR